MVKTRNNTVIATKMRTLTETKGLLKELIRCSGMPKEEVGMIRLKDLVAGCVVVEVKMMVKHNKVTI